MNKKINLTISDSANKLDGFDNLHVNELDSVFSCSLDMVYCSIFNIFTNDNAYQALDAILEKLRPGGQLIISVFNIKRLAALYLSGSISDNDFFNNIKSSNNSIQYAEVIKHIISTGSSSIIDVKKDELITFLTVSKDRI